MSIFKEQSIPYALLLLLLDGGCILLAAFLASVFTQDPAAEISFVEHFAQHTIYAGAFFVTWFWVALSLHLFRSGRKDDLFFQLSGVAKAGLISIAFCGLAVLYWKSVEAETTVLTYFGVFSIVFLAVYRAMLCLCLWGVRQWGLNVRYIVVVGANERTLRLIRSLVRHPRMGYQIIGLLDDDADRMKMLREFEHRISYLGGFKDLEKVLANNVVDEVHICLPVRSCYELIQSMANYCVGLGIAVRMVADLFPLRIATSRLHHIENIPMLSLSTAPDSGIQLALKRTIDVFGALFLLVLLSPLFVVAGIVIKLDSPGPVFFTQDRVGLNQRRFRMIKFRSMVSNAEALKKELEDLNEADGPVFKIRNDPRVTRMGRFIRKYSIDEFPQLINVLKGEMSLVGPRPLPQDEIEKQSWDQRRRLSVKPGMTGLWQVSGRSDLKFQEWVDLDLQYIDTWSIVQDFVILVKTVSAVFQARGAV